jgi:hypothetical protein
MKLIDPLEAIVKSILYTIKMYNNGDIEVIEGVLQNGNRETFKVCTLEVTPKRIHILHKDGHSLFGIPFNHVIQIINEDTWKKH